MTRRDAAEARRLAARSGQDVRPAAGWRTAAGGSRAAAVEAVWRRIEAENRLMDAPEVGVGYPPDQAAWREYSQMSAPQRHLVDLWGNLGYSRAEALEIVRERVRSHAVRASTTSSSAPVGRWGATLEAEERWPTGSTERRRRVGSEHEACHAVVAEQLGFPVATAEVYSDGGGQTIYQSAGRSKVDLVAVAVAPRVWTQDHRIELGADHQGHREDDRKIFLELGADDFLVRRAWQVATVILRDQRQRVFALADELERRGRVTFNE